ncbi:MAG: rod shape-determining protein RodA [Ruminococcus sp.]|uniref:Rod shape-determining protein RodA n=1 Tax=Schaedlerella arabinosiphila TaxID=2044587 RepID=A0A426DFL5_9FIRM|nr:FtsW/RodA/SpoVE family cell cycle protein [Schaedlerella arabinosiphila]MCI8722532.1 rod shape-determining protein RodA [Ruminococcus sp.]MCI9602830.1 rod shape-determining protein RodA [Ruminococcus sp.]MCI9632094.1 rod shape-determining protein RodA [Ruminococcus sp.]MDE7066439.1 rod shape-determining protein RodA [Schaedlerella arabinosiphila]RRK31534.1 rod shape-determining protein RodA [Schaedlerella arabinosiphila]
MKTFIQNIRQRYHLKDYKFSLVALVLTISVIGVFIVGSAQASSQGKQVQGVILGVIAMAVISLIDYEWVLNNFYWLMYVVNIAFLVAVLLFGVNTNGATRWLNLGFIQFQPSDLTKIITILFYAKLLSKYEQAINHMRFIIVSVVLMLPSLALIYKQPNLSNTLCLAMLFCVLMYMGGLSYKFIRTVLVIFVPLAVVLFIIVIQPNQPLIHQYQQNRILAWLEPEKYESEEAYQQLNSIMAIGSGQLTGKGYNSDATTSVKNGNFISEPQTDFIFAIIGEELGFVGCCAVIILLLLIVIDCILIGMKAKDTAGRIICAGVAALIGIQSFINISVATMLFPNTGISLPFISYGMTSVVCFYMGIGFVLNVGLQPNKYQ